MLLDLINSTKPEDSAREYNMTVLRPKLLSALNQATHILVQVNAGAN